MRTSGSLLWGELFPFSTEFARCSGAVGPVEVCFFMVLRTLHFHMRDSLPIDSTIVHALEQLTAMMML